MAPLLAPRRWQQCGQPMLRIFEIPRCPIAYHGASVAEVTVSRYVTRRPAELGLDKL